MRKKFLFICLSWLIALTANADNLNLYLTTDGLTADPNSSTPYATTDTSIEEGTQVSIRYAGVDNTTVLSIYINGEVVSSGTIYRMRYNQPYTFTAKKNCILRVEGDYAFNFATNPNVYFTQDVDVTGVTLSQTEAAMTVGGETLTLTATVAPANATNKTVTWTSSDESVATVANGVVTAVAAGTATITATATNGTADTGDDVSATCAVTVSTATYSVALKDGTEDATNWQGKAGEGTYQQLPLSGLEAGTAVSLKYSGRKRVRGVKAVKKEAAAGKPVSEITPDDIFKVIASNGIIYDNIAAAESAGTVAQGLVVYVGSNTENENYNHGLALALNDENNNTTWGEAINACNAKNTSTPIVDALWILPSQGQWNTMFTAAGGDWKLRDCFSSAGGNNMVIDGEYWSSTGDSEWVWYFMFSGHDWEGTWGDIQPRYNYICKVRACIVF